MTGEDTGTIRSDQDDVENNKITAIAIINASLEDEGLLKMRTNMDNLDLFQSFINYCLIHFTTSINWRYKACNTIVSDIFTETDEALCILLLENNAGDYKRAFDEQRRINRKEAKPRYTKVHSVNKKFQGWDKKGIKRFNVIVKAVKECRELEVSKEMEMKLKSRYVTICGRDGDEDESDGEDSDSDDNDVVDEHAYDGFAGMSGITNVTAL